MPSTGRRALIFDYDGLMVDSEMAAAQAIIDWFANRGRTVRLEDFGHLFGSTSPDVDLEWRRVLAGWVAPNADLEAVIADLDEAIEAAKAKPVVLPGVRELLEAATPAGWRVGLATGCERQVLLARLTGLGLVDSFDQIVTAPEVPRGKPHPDIYLETASRLGVDPSACVVLEDSVFGCHAALAAGMTVVACPSPVTAWCQFPDQVLRVASLADLSLADIRQAVAATDG